MSQQERRAAPPSPEPRASVTLKKRNPLRQRLINLGLATVTGLASLGFSPGIGRAEENAKPTPQEVLLSTDGPYEQRVPVTEAEQKKQLALEAARGLVAKQLNLSPDLQALFDEKTFDKVFTIPKNPNYYSVSVYEPDGGNRSVNVSVVLGDDGQLESASINAKMGPYLDQLKAADGINSSDQIGVEKVRGYLADSAKKYVKGEGKWTIGRDIHAKITSVPGSRDNVWELGRTILDPNYSTVQRVSAGLVKISVTKSFKKP